MSSSNAKGLLSVVIPAYNEEANVVPAYERIHATFSNLDLDYEIIFCVDPCTDNTETEILSLRESDARVKMLRFSRRFGQPAATLAGLRMAAGEASVVIDCDLQDPPELIAEMVKKWRQGYDVVYARRRSRQGETLLKRIVSAVGYSVINRAADVEIPPNTGDFRLMSRRVVGHVVALSESHGFLRGLVATVGYPQTSVLYDRDARAEGKGKYNRFWGSLLIGMNGLIGFSRYPLRVISLLGITLSMFAFLLGIAYVTLKFAGVAFPTGNPTVVVIISLFSGIQLLSLGIMGEYVGRIYDEVKNRPLYIIESAHGFSVDASVDPQNADQAQYRPVSS